MQAFTARVTAGRDGPRAGGGAVRFFVRDGIWYDPFGIVTDPDAYRAGRVDGAVEQLNAYPRRCCCTAATERQDPGPAQASPTSATTSTTPRLRGRMGGADCSSGLATALAGRWVKVRRRSTRSYCAQFGVRAGRLRRRPARCCTS
ncbi:hypothetical protein HBB16_11245 [Pseudonocardia sp. MCCB 268]|nr:hypothetical protein [Pseudonocardia cytotoxica]